MNKQYHLLFQGKVQGVWFRSKSKNLADKHKIKGWVKNLANGKVEMVIESQPEKIDAFLIELEKNFKNNIFKIEKKEKKIFSRLDSFKIVY